MAGIMKRMRKKYKRSSPYCGKWLKWLKRKVKGDEKIPNNRRNKRG